MSDPRAKEQDAAFMKKYGSVKPKRHLIEKESKHFDSADWAMERSQAQKQQTGTSSIETTAPRTIDANNDSDNTHS